MDSGAHRRTRGYWKNVDNVRQELEALAVEQQADTTIEFVELAQAASRGATDAGKRISAYPLPCSSVLTLGYPCNRSPYDTHLFINVLVIWLP